MDELLTSSQAARILGVGSSSLKRWADDGVIGCIRTEGGHRRFPRDEVERMRTRLAGGSAEGEIATWVERLVNDREVLAIEGALLTDRSRRGAWFRVADVVGPVLTEIGQRWHDGALSVLEEHIASERLARAIARCGESIPLPAAAPAALLATPAGEEHTLGLSLAELCLREAGWSTRWAGHNTPFEDLLRAVEDGGIRMLALSASTAFADGDPLSALVSRLTEACRGAEVTLVLGGRGPWPEAQPPARRIETFSQFNDLLRELEPEVR